MSKTHYSTKVGKMMPCEAQDVSTCRASQGNEFGIEKMPHFESRVEALAYHENLLNKKFGAVSSLVKKKRSSRAEAIVEEDKKNEIKRDGEFAYVKLGDSTAKVKLREYSDETKKTLRQVSNMIASSLNSSQAHSQLPIVTESILIQAQKIGLTNEVAAFKEKYKNASPHEEKSLYEDLKKISNTASSRYKDALLGYEQGSIAALNK